MKKILILLLICPFSITQAQVKKKPADTLKINIPKDKNFNPTNGRLSNSKIKTPVYNNALKGTNAPGDPNTGISTNTLNHRPTTNKTLERVKEMKDSNNRSKPLVN